MRKLLDKMFANTKLSVLIPFAIATADILLFAIFGTSEEKLFDIATSIIACAFWFFGCFLVFFIQVKNPICPEKYLNFCELFATFFFGVFSVIQSISFLVGGFQNYSPIVCVGIVTYGAIAWAHSKRVKNTD